MNCKTLLVGIAIAIPMLITGCSKKGTIEITTPPPAALEVNQSASIAATVTGDLASAGVDWTCTPAGACGTFVPAHTASGGATVYMAPRVSGPVSIIATSTKKDTKHQSASVTINPVATATDLTGTYIFYVNGYDSDQQPYSVAGSVNIDGATGMITGGEQDYFAIGSVSNAVFPADPITAGSITVGADGRGTLSVTPTSAPAETFSITVVNNKHILITEFDSNAVANGSMDFQTAPTSVPTGGNAFALMDATDANAFGGVFTSNGTLITASKADDDLASTTHFGFAMTGSTFTAPTNGRGTITFVDPNFGVPFTLIYYVVGPEAFRLIEVDGLIGFATGSMYGQGAGGFSAASLGSKFVFGQSGVEAPGTGIGLYSAAGQFAGNGTSAFSSGVADVNLGDGTPVLAGSLTTGTTYSVGTDGYGAITLTGANTDGLANFGIYMVDPAINVADPNNTSGGGGAVMLDLDVNDIGIGIVVPQATSPTFTGNFAFSMDGANATTQDFLYGLVGEVTSDGASKVAGLVDYNELPIGLNPAVTVAGTYTADATNSGRSTLPLTINGAATPNQLTLYQASSSLVLHIDVDSPANTTGVIGFGVFEQQQ
jgi:hypothetical protein